MMWSLCAAVECVVYEALLVTSKLTDAYRGQGNRGLHAAKPPLVSARGRIPSYSTTANTDTLQTHAAGFQKD